MNTHLTFLKLGGSLITDKEGVAAPKLERIKRLADEIAMVRRAQPEMRLLLGHGSGSFGHVAAKKHGTHKGVRNSSDWLGFIEVWRQAAALNHIVLDALAAADLPVLAFPPSGAASAEDGAIFSWDIATIEAALDADLIPVIYGDVAFDRKLGGTILSTEELFNYLAERLKPQRILLAATEPVYADYPDRQNIIPRITISNMLDYSPVLSQADTADVTGGMASKVELMLDLVTKLPETEIRIFSGTDDGSLAQALEGKELGTRIG